MKRIFKERMTETMIYLPPGLIARYGHICRELGISKSAFARTSIQHFVNMYELRGGNAEAGTPGSDIDDFDYGNLAEAHLKYETGWRK
ncbi:MAG: hypothetical protein LBK22_01935 [Tannerella sp.]|jgi:hypothetical protein|nr:hypothetical protein [Tannerella sp.]